MNASGKAVFATLLLLLPIRVFGQGVTWVATWAASPEAVDPDPEEPISTLSNQTVRERIRATLGGSQIRICLSNEYSNSPVLIGSVSAGIALTAGDVKAGTLQRVTFGGKDSITIPPGAPALSDPVNLAIRNGSEIAISLYFPTHVASFTGHSLALKSAVISLFGDHTGDLGINGGREFESSVFLSQVLVAAQSNSRVIVAFGDSLVDGDKSTPGADHSWPNDLFRRLQDNPGKSLFAVVNEGIAGNRLLRNGPVASLGMAGLARFDRDALGVPGVTTIVLLEGTNDIGFPGAKSGNFSLAPPGDAPTTDEMIAGYQQLVSRAHARGIRIVGCTIMPTAGAAFTGYHSETKERLRQAINHWIRASHTFDGVIDFDAALRDPDHPSRLIPSLVSNDHLHPNDHGYQRMADAIDLSVLR